MKKKLYKNRALFVLISSIIILLSACLRPSDSEVKPLPALPFKGQELVKTLAGQSALHLFNQAFNRLSLSGSVSPNTGYTIFAPVDSAMKAAGLDSAGISKMNIDSLRKLISYQIAIGIFDDKALSSSVTTIQALTLRQDIITLPSGSQSTQPAALYIKEDQVIYLNGIPVVKSAPAIQASNGYIYPVTVVSKAPSKTLYDIIKSDPDLTLYNQAIILGDSIRDAAIIPIFGSSDVYTDDVYNFSNPPFTPKFFPTVLAPTNKAFNDAGFHTIDDVRKFALRSYTGFDLNTFANFYYSPIDSVLKRHMIYNINVGMQAINTISILYSDMLSPAINNGIDNTFVGPATTILTSPYNLQYTVPLKFSASNGSVYVNWSNDPKVPAVILPRDVNPQKPVDNFVTSNGALYKIDKLFYPIVK